MSNEQAPHVKRTTQELEKFGAYVMLELADQCGGINSIDDIHPLDVMPSTGITVDLAKRLQANFDKLVIIGINEANEEV